MQEVEESIDQKYLGSCKDQDFLQPKEQEHLNTIQEKQRTRAYLNSQGQKLKKMINFVRDLGVFREMTLPLQSLRQQCVPQAIIKKLNEKDVIKASQIRYQRMLRTGIVKKNWSIEDLSIIVWLVVKFGQTNTIPLQDVQFHKECWEMIQSMVVGTNAEQCLFKWMGFKKITVTMYAWTKQEEYLLSELQSIYKIYQNKWKIISKQLFKRNPNQNKIYRQPKQCREHFNSFLDPSIKKGVWSKQQDYMLICAYLKFNCQRKWCQITHFFKNRTENSLKNRFQLIYSRIKIITSSQKSNELEMLKKYTKHLREEISRFGVEDQMVSDADRMRKEALQGNFITSNTKKKHHQVSIRQRQEQSILKQEEIDLTNKDKKKQKQSEHRGKGIELNENNNKSQTEIGSSPRQVKKLNIIIPTFQYKQNINRENLLLPEKFVQHSNLFQIQNISNPFKYFFQKFYSDDYFRNNQLLKEQKKV